MTNRKLAAARVGWDPQKMAGQQEDIRLKILCYAILAPNPHNTQAWLVELSRNDVITLYIDPKRLLPVSDPLHRLIYESQGTFLETLSIAAKEFGYEAQIQLFPEGIDPLEKTGTSPVAVVKLLTSDIKKDNLFCQIPKRVSNRRPYSGPALSGDELKLIQNSYVSLDHPLVLITEPEMMGRVADLMTEAMRIETYLDRTHRESVDNMRFSDAEVIATRDGFSYENMGVTGMSRFFVEKLSPKNKAFGSLFRKSKMNSTQKGAHTARVMGLIIGPGNSRINQVEVGRRFARLFLKATELGLAIQPMNQLLQEYEELSGVRESFLEMIQSLQPGSVLPAKDMVTKVPTAQFLFRIGRAKPTPHSPRRDLKDFLKS